MKIKGQDLRQPNTETLVLPREDGEIVLKFQSVLDTDEFDKQFPSPEPPYIRRPGDKGATPDFEDKVYKAKMEEYGQMKTKWMFLKSVQATEGLEWEIVKLNDPKTWDKVDEELKQAGFNQFEIARIYQAMMRVNALDEEYLAQARKRFFESRRPKKEDQS